MVTKTTTTRNKHSSSKKKKTTKCLSHLPELCLEVEGGATLPEEGSFVLLYHVAIGVRLQCWRKLESNHMWPLCNKLEHELPQPPMQTEWWWLFP